jgi:FKBP-type peptidyl-prolyl cis-trans isomerase SlyD
MGDPTLAIIAGEGALPRMLSEALTRAGRAHIACYPHGLDVEVPAAEAYGEHDPRQVQDVLRELLPVAGVLKEGDRFQVGDDAAAPIVTVVAVKGDTVTLDGNHPLAGVALTFEVEVVSARVATPEELAHGHVHGPDGRCS